MSLPISSPELTLLRTRGHGSKLYAAIFKPSTVYSARLATLPTSFDKVFEISYTSGSGTLSDVKKDMDIWIGSSAGKHDLGIVRNRRTPGASTFYISEDSDVRWQTSCYLTVVNYFDLHARHINVVDDDTFFMDHGEVYSDQHTNFDPVPVMGGHRVLKKTGSSVSSVWTGANSWVIGSSISAYSWSCATASSSSGTSTATPTFSFNSLGWHLVYLTVTAANGKTGTGVRYVYVYDKDHLPEPIFDLGNPSVDYETGGWSFDFSMTAADVADVPDRALVILFREDYYGNTNQSIGALAGCENIECVGKIAEESITVDPQQSFVTFRVQGYHYWFQKIMGYPSGLEQVTGTPASWVEMQSLTVDKALFHFLRWRTTATVIMDCYLTNDTRLASELSSPAENLWSQIQEFSFTTIFANPGVDRFGRLFIRIDPQCVPEDDRDFPVSMTIQEGDWEPPLQIDRMTVDENGLIDFSGVSVDASNTGTAIFSLSPGHVMKHYGTIETIDRLLLQNQELSNEEAGLLLAWRDNEFPGIEMPLTQNNPVLDCFPPQYVAWTLSTGDNARGISIDGNLIPRRVERRIGNGGFIQTIVTLELATTAESVNTIIGDVPGSDDTSHPPGVDPFPPLPPFPIILPGDIGGNAEGELPVLLHDVNAGFVYSLNGDVASPNWLLMNGGLTTAQKQGANGAFICPNGAVYVFRVKYDDDGFIARAPALGGTFTIIEDATSIKAKYGAVTTGVWGVACNPLAPESVAYIIGTSGTANLYYGSGTSFTQGIALPGLGNNGIAESVSQDFVKLSYGFGSWLLTARKNTPSLHEHYWKLSTTSIIQEGTYASLGLGADGVSHMRAGTTGIIYVVNNASTKYYQSTDNFTTLALINVTINSGGASVGAAIDLVGTQIMNRYDAAALRGKSNDGGASYSTMGSLPAGNWFFEYAGGSGSSSWWFATSGSAFRLSKNFGSTWPNAEGDITSIIPFPNVNLIRIGGVTT